MIFHKLLIRASLLVILINLWAFSLSQAQTARQIAQKTFPSVVLLVMEDANGQPISLGSGFFVRENIIATNMHVVEGAARGYAKIVGQKPKYDISGIVGINSKLDLVLLTISGTKAPLLSLGDSRQVAVGDNIYVVGNPMGLEGTFSQGIVSSVRQIGSDTLMQITAPISPGSSGGPVLDVQGKVIGVAVATYKGGQNLNFAIPSSYLAELLIDMKPISPLSTKKMSKVEKSILVDLGGRSTEGVVGAQLTWTYTFGLSGEYSFSLRNNLRYPIKNVYCLVIFYDFSGKSIDVGVVRYNGTIPAGLAKRVIGYVHQSVQILTTDTARGDIAPSTKVEFRVLNFEIVE